MHQSNGWRARLAAHWPTKLLLAVVLNLWVALPYHTLQRWPWRAVTTLAPSWLEDAVPFVPQFAWLYLSLYLLIPIGPLLLATRAELRRYASGIVFLGLAANLAFFLMPTMVARPADSGEGLYGLLVALDLPLNACPSLHAALAVYSVLCLGQVITAARWQALAWLWTLGILFATLALRQHVLIDLVLGSAIGGIAYRLAWSVRQRGSITHADVEPIAAPTLVARRQVAAGIDARLAALRGFHPLRRLLEIAIFTALWLGGAALALTALAELPASWPQYGLRLLGAVIAAAGLNAYVLLLHEGMHHTLFSSPFWNRWVSVLLGAPVLMSFSAYQVLHLRHHTFLGDPRDPDDYHNYSGSRRTVWLMHFVRLACGAFLYLLFIPLLALRHGTPVARRRVLVEYAFLAILWATVAWAVPGSVLLHGWFFPVVLVGLFTNVRGFTQHGITDAGDPYLASRTMKPHPVVAFCLLNENYHLEHHLFPEVPSYHLRELHELIWPRLPRAVCGTSYSGFLARFLRATLTMDETPIGLTAPAECERAEFP